MYIKESGDSGVLSFFLLLQVHTGGYRRASVLLHRLTHCHTAACFTQQVAGSFQPVMEEDILLFLQHSHTEQSKSVALEKQNPVLLTYTLFSIHHHGL